MRRREFLEAALCTGVVSVSGLARAFPAAAAPMALGLVITPRVIRSLPLARVKELGLSTCFLSLDAYIGKFNQALADQMQDAAASIWNHPDGSRSRGSGKVGLGLYERPSDDRDRSAGDSCSEDGCAQADIRFRKDVKHPQYSNPLRIHP